MDPIRAAVRIYDSARREVVPFEPLEPGQVRIYDCGPTVYDWQHIGNVYRYIVADVVRRTFEHLGYRVTQVMNVTDVGHIVEDLDQGDDKMELAARRERKDPQALAKTYTDRFMDDRRKLNILDPHVMPKATDHIPQMIALIGKLIDSGHAYVASDGVYFDVSTFAGYGQRLNREGIEAREAGARVAVNPNKRHPFDFALWRAAKPGDLQQWDSPWGRGNPGWHIECSAMSMHYLGETFDIHSGGEDHLFPHHECEIAQSEAATGQPFARYWMHVYFLMVEGEAMHKSIGNVYLLSDIEERGFDPLAFRLQSLGVGYRSHMDFTWRGLEDAQRRLEKWRSSVAGATLSVPAPAGVDPSDPIRQQFVAAITDDLNTAAALAAAENAIKLTNSPERADQARGLGLLFDMDRVLGLGLAEWAQRSTAIDDEVRALLAERDAARARGDYARSDELREDLRRRGYLVKDTKEGQRWERIPIKAGETDR
ncbi:MAG: cysteine--tRNA ligase [Chloroflexota bacterium]